MTSRLILECFLTIFHFPDLIRDSLMILAKNLIEIVLQGVKVMMA